MPEAFAAFAVGESEAFTFAWVIEQLARPFVPERVEHRDRKRKAIHVTGEEPPFPATSFESARDIVEEPYSDVARQVLKEGFHQDENVKLFLAC